uniref:Transposase (Putative), gypsy type n=1 Tax=Tanacetum cinerariifolium TaxID=118510 RepID=A0A699HF02_TANCI|nr:transposase (putative), gypsy type [Tanacetum cinerariifolium]
MGRDTIQLETAMSTISQEYLLEFTSEYGISEDVHPELLGLEDWIVDFPEDMDLFNLINAPNPSKVKTGLRPRVAHEVPLLTEIASRAIDMEDPDAATEGGGCCFGTPLEQKRGRRVNDEADANAPPKVVRKDYASVHPGQSTRGGKFLPTMGLAAGATSFTPADTKGVNDPDPLSNAESQPHPEQSMTQSYEVSSGNVAIMEVQDTRSAESAGSGKSTSFSSMVGEPEDIYHPGWGMTNSCRLDTPDACQDVVDHIVPPRYFFELRHMPNVEFLSHYNKKLARQTQVTGEELIKAAFEEFKKYEDDRVEKRSTEMDSCLDALSIDFNKELYPHTLTAIVGHQWAIGHGLRLAVMKCAESIELRQAFANVMSAGIAQGMSKGLAHGIEHGKASRGLEVVEAYDPEANNKYLQALQELKDLKYPIVDQLESLKDAPIEVIMTSLYLESNSREDAPKWIRDLRPSTSQLKIQVYPEVRDPRDPWAVKDEMLLEEAIAANVSRAEKKKRCQVVCRTHGIGSAHHARSDGVPVSVPTIAPQGLAILLADAATQTKTSEDDASPRLLRSKSLPPMYNIDWP